jgi:cold shock CspA family protein
MDYDADTVYVGHLVAWHQAGYGFIRPDGGERDDDVFVVRSVLPDSALLSPGAKLKFGVVQTSRGRQALWCALIDD